MKPRLTFLSLSLIVAVLPAQAQVPAMNLVGNVQSDDQRALPGAAIIVIHVPSGARHVAASDATGRFIFSNLMAGGPYLMQVGEGGYRPQTMGDIFLENGKTASYTVILSKITTGSAGQSRPSQGAEALAPPDAPVPTGPVDSPGLVAATAVAVAQGATPAARKAPAAMRGAYSTRFQPVAQVVTAAPAAAPAAAAAAMVSAPAVSTPPAPAPRYSRFPRRTTPPHPDPIVPGRYDARTGNYLYNTGPLTALKLPDGAVVLAVGTNSTESYLHRFLTDPGLQVDTVDLTNGWYNFDKVFFETGKAALTAGSLGQLRNIAARLRAFPRARVKIGGYTDDTGEYRTNKQLSETRARTAWTSLVDMGISPGRIDTRGYGPSFSIASNATEEGRAQNRRISIKVLQK